jgi:hypothetical protein
MEEFEILTAFFIVMVSIAAGLPDDIISNQKSQFG